MAYDTGYSRRSSSERDLQPVAIVSVDPTARLAVGATRTRHTVRINCAYATGDTITTPAVGEQWYCERFDNEWRLYGRIPFNDPTLNIEPEAGQVSVGSGTGPLELNGTEVRSNAKVLRLNGVYYRDGGQTLERSVDQVTWEAITAGALVQIVAKALTDYEGATQAGAVTALEGWAGIVQEVIDNFTLFWNLICGNVFVNGLKRLGVGGDDVERIVDGFQNFINYLFGIVFCDFTGDLTPQTLLARLRDLIAPIAQNPFVLGLQQVADILGVAVGNLLNDAVAGTTAFLKLVFDIVFCRWDELLPQLANLGSIIDLVGEDSPFSPATIIKQLFGTFSFLGDPNNPVGAFFLALQDFFQVLFESTGSLLQDAVGGAVEFVQVLFDVLFCQADPAKLAAILGAAGGAFGPTAIIQAIDTFFQFFRDNPFITGLRDFFVALTGQEPGNLIQDVVGGATEFVQLIFRIITCDPTVLTDLADLVDGIIPDAIDPLGILAFLKPLLDGLLANPLVVMIQAFAEDILGNTGTLLEQIIEGTGDLMNLILKAVKTFLPFIPWSALFPFVNWTAVDAAVFPSLASVFSGFDPLDIFGPLDDLIGGAFTTFLTNLNTFFSGMGLFNSNFNPATAVDYFLQNVLGLFNSSGEFLYAITADSLDGLGDWIKDNIFNNVAPSQFFNNLTELLGTDLRISTGDFASNFVAIANAFIARIKFLLLGGYTSLTEWGQAQITTPIISSFLSGLKLDPTKFGVTDLSNIGVNVMADIARTLLTTLGTVPAQILEGVLPPGVTGTVPVSNVSNTTPNLITLGKFSESVNIEAADGWSWDSTQNAPGSAGGSAKTTVSSVKNRYLFSRQAVRVAEGDRLVVNATVKTSALTVSSALTPSVSIELVPFIGSAAQTAVPIGSTASIFGTTNWATIGNTDNSAYKITNAAWTSVIVRLRVSNVVTAGTVWWDDISLRKIGGLIQYNVDSLVPTWQQMWDGAFGSGGSTKNWEDMFSLQYTINETATTGVTNSGIADGKAQGTIDGINQGITGATGSGALPSTVLDNIGGLSDLTSGFTQSGSNLLPDPKIDSPRLWKQPGLAVSTAFSNSTSQSLEFTANANGTARSFYFPTNAFIPYAIGTWPDRIYYVECYVYLPAANPNTTATVNLFAQGTILPSNVGTNIPAMTFAAAGTWSSVTLTNPVRAGGPFNGWYKLFGYFKVPTLRNGFTAGITFTAANASYKLHIDDLAIIDVTESVTTNDKLYGRPVSTDTLITGAIPSGIPSGRILGTSGTGTITTEVTGLNSAVGSTSNGTGLSGTVYGTNGNGGLVGTGGTTTTVTNTFNNVFGTGGLIPKLYGPSATAPANKIQEAALPNTVGAVGSGIILKRESNSNYAAKLGTGYSYEYLETGFFNATVGVINTGDLAYDTNISYTSLRALNAGWYLIELGFALNFNRQYNFWWSFSPVIYETRNLLAKFGSTAVSSRDTNVGVTFSLTPGFVQSSFIVYMAPGDRVYPAYAARKEYNPTGTEELIGISSGGMTYFSGALLNKSLL